MTTREKSRAESQQAVTPLGYTPWQTEQRLALRDFFLQEALAGKVLDG